MPQPATSFTAMPSQTGSSIAIRILAYRRSPWLRARSRGSWGEERPSGARTRSGSTIPRTCALAGASGDLAATGHTRSRRRCRRCPRSLGMPSRGSLYYAVRAIHCIRGRQTGERHAKFNFRRPSADSDCCQHKAKRQPKNKCPNSRTMIRPDWPWPHSSQHSFDHCTIRENVIWSALTKRLSGFTSRWERKNPLPSWRDGHCGGHTNSCDWANWSRWRHAVVNWPLSKGAILFGTLKVYAAIWIAASAPRTQRIRHHIVGSTIPENACHPWVVARGHRQDRGRCTACK